MKVHQAKIAKQALASLPPEKRQLMFLLGHAANEINILSKLALMGRRKDNPHQLTRQVETGQTLTLLLLHIGKLFEAWDLLKRRVEDCPKNKHLITDLPTVGKAAYERLKTALEKGNALVKIRNNLSFHYYDQGNLVEKSFRSLPATEPWDLILHETRCNSFYWPSAMIVSHAMMQLAAAGDSAHELEDYSSRARNALDDLVKLTTEISGHMSTLLDEVIALVLKPIAPEFELAEAEIGGVPKLTDCFIPFFVDETN